MNGWGKGNVSFSPFISFFVFLSEGEQCGTTFLISCLKDMIQNVLTVQLSHSSRLGMKHPETTQYKEIEMNSFHYTD